MSRHAVAISATFLILLAITVSPKMMPGAAEIYPDEDRLASEVFDVLHSAGFAVRRAKGPGALVLASRGTCNLEVYNGDYANELRTVFERLAPRNATVRYGYRSRWMSAPWSLRPHLERAVQNQLASIGIATSRPASIALFTVGDCKGVTMRLDGLRVFAKRKRYA